MLIIKWDIFNRVRKKQALETVHSAVRMKCYFSYPEEQMSLVKGKIVTWEREWEQVCEMGDVK